MHAPSLSGVRLIDALPGARLQGGEHLRFTSVSSDPSNCRPGDLFVALTSDGELFADGHQQADLAIARGAAAIVTERLLPLSVPQCIVRDTQAAYSRICLALMGRPQDSLKLVGVTGTRGKTVTAALIESVFAAAGHASGSVGSLGYSGPDGREPWSGAPTSPEWARRLGQLVAAGAEVGVLEVGCRDLAERRVAGVEFDAAVLTSLWPAHLDRHNSFDAYRRIKRRLFGQLRREGVAIVNADDRGCMELADELACPMLTYGVDEPADITATILDRNRGEQTFLLSAGRDSIPVRTRILGDAHVRNALAATAAGLVAGLDLADIVAGIERVTELPGRLERMVCGQDCGVFLDVADDPRTLTENLRALRAVTSGRLLCVLGVGPTDSAEECALRGRTAERHADWSMITSSRIDTKASLHLAHEVMDGYQRAARAHFLPSRAAAIREALSRARPQDTVLIAGAGRDSLESLAGDRELVREALVDGVWRHEPRILKFPGMVAGG